jgi:hypothetical protein
MPSACSYHLGSSHSCIVQFEHSHVLYMHLCHVYGAVSAFCDLPSQPVFLVCFHRTDMALAHFFVSWAHMLQLNYWQPVVVLCGCVAYASGALAYFCCALVHCTLGVYNDDSSLFLSGHVALH